METWLWIVIAVPLVAVAALFVRELTALRKARTPATSDAPEAGAEDEYAWEDGDRLEGRRRAEV